MCRLSAKESSVSNTIIEVTRLENLTLKSMMSFLLKLFHLCSALCHCTLRQQINMLSEREKRGRGGRGGGGRGVYSPIDPLENVIIIERSLCCLQPGTRAAALQHVVPASTWTKHTLSSSQACCSHALTTYREACVRVSPGRTQHRAHACIQGTRSLDVLHK